MPKTKALPNDIEEILEIADKIKAARERAQGFVARSGLFFPPDVITFDSEIEIRAFNECIEAAISKAARNIADLRDLQKKVHLA